MPIQVKCSSCPKQYRVKDELRGKKFKCKQCGTVNVIEPISGVSASSASGRRKKKSGPARKKKKEPAYEDDYGDSYSDDPFGGALDNNNFGTDYDDDSWDDDAYGDESFADTYGSNTYGADALPQPTRKKKKKKKKSSAVIDTREESSGGGLPLTFNPNRFNIGLAVFGCVVVFWGIQEMRLALKASSDPQKIELADLMLNGPGTEVYFTVTNVVPNTKGCIVETVNDKIEKVWLPCVVDDSPNNAEFIIYSSDIEGEMGVESLVVAGTHTGMIINDISGLGSEEQKLLRENGINPDNAYIFEVGRKPSGFMKYGGMMGGGLLLLLMGGAWMLLVHDE